LGLGESGRGDGDGSKILRLVFGEERKLESIQIQMCRPAEAKAEAEKVAGWHFEKKIA